MAKDPAMLWYWGDWHSGTSLMSRFLKGCYMDLLHAQFNHGPLSLENVKQILGMDFGNAWPSLQKKFSVNPDGLFLNERMEYEKEKRKKHSEHQRNNALMRWHKNGISDGNAMDMPLENENENEISLVLKKEIQNEKTLSEMDVGKTVQFCSITLHRNYSEDQVKKLWEAFLIQNEKECYLKPSDQIKHFREWIKFQPYETKKTNGFIDPDKLKKELEKQGK